MLTSTLRILVKKSNTEGVAKGNPGTASCGGLVRNDVGEWVVGFDLKIGYCSAYNAESWGILRGI